MKTEMKRWQLKKARAILEGLGAAACFGWAAPDAAASVSSNSPSAETLTVSLEYQEVAYTVMSLGWAVADQPGAFKREPQADKTKARRGRLNFPITNVPPMPFLWDYAQGKLYLDLNRNEDLTDDPAGVFSSAVPAGFPSSYRHGQFTNVHLNFPTAVGRQPWLLDLNLSEYRGRLNAYAGVRSFWAGKVVLAGREWQVGVIDNPAAKRGAAGGGHLLLRPWENRDETFSVSDGSLDAFPFARKLFIQTRAYAVDCAYLQDGDKLRCQLKLQERPAELGELKLSGQFIQRVHLRDGPCLVVLDAPAEVVHVPVGRYGDHLARLGKGNAVAHPERSDRGVTKPLIVAKDKPATLVAGGPLTNSVTLTPRGGQLVFNYRLVGAGGETYQFGTTDRTKPPQFAVYQGDKRIASGKFEFG
jgi:hypothetical protein